MAKRPYPSPYANQIVAFVRANPGCTKMDVAMHVRYSSIHPGKLYRLVNTAIRSGAVQAEQKPSGVYSLTVPEES